MLGNTKQSYGAVTRWLHWIIALAIIAMLIIGFSLSLFHGPTFKTMMFVHKSLGFTILVLMVFRLIWRLCQPTPELPQSMAKHEKFLAHAMAWLLYLVTFIIIAAGILMTTYHGLGINVWGLFTVHFNVTANKATAHLFANIHVWFAWLLITALVLHIFAAVYHQYIRKDDILKRMVSSSHK